MPENNAAEKSMQMEITDKFGHRMKIFLNELIQQTIKLLNLAGNNSQSF